MAKYLYRSSLLEAKRNNEVELWRESHRANIECKKAIEQSIFDNYDGTHLKGETAKDLCDIHGIDRVGWVLANTVQHHDWDGRYRPYNRNWANEFTIPKGEAKDYAFDFCVNSHPEIINGLINQYREHVLSLNLHGKEAVIKSDEPQNYTNKLLILSPYILCDEYKNGDYQYFYAKSGFGCDGDAIGRKVFGFFLKDGENTHFNRSDFIGIADTEQLPEWAVEKLSEIQNQEQDNNNCFEMKMNM